MMPFVFSISRWLCERLTKMLTSALSTTSEIVIATMTSTSVKPRWGESFMPSVQTADTNHGGDDAPAAVVGAGAVAGVVVEIAPACNAFGRGRDWRESLPR